MTSPLGSRADAVQRDKAYEDFSNLKALAPNIRPLSDATEFYDETDFEYDSDEDAQVDSSPRFSLNSTGRRSETTLSSYEEVATPRSNHVKGFNFRIDIQEKLPEEEDEPLKPVEGPRGPHLYAWQEHVLHHQTPEIELTEEDLAFYFPISPVEWKGPARSRTAFKAPPPVPASPPRNYRPISSMTEVLDKLEKHEVAKWSPRQVARWMSKAGFEASIVEKFEAHDISGAILLTMKWDDLEYLDIPSFGKRHLLWGEIDQLKGRNDGAQSPCPPTDIECESSEDEQRERRRPRKKRSRPRGMTSPVNTVSFVGFEQLMPKPHRCGKGENCSRWRKQQKLIAAFKNEHPTSPMGGSFMIAGDPGNPLTAEAARPFSDLAPSVVASSDFMGPGTPAFRQIELQPEHLGPSTLARVKYRDPQDNVKQFLSFQHVERPGPPEEHELFPSTPPRQLVPQSTSQDARFELPRLAIPSPHDVGVRSASAMDMRTSAPGPMERGSPISLRLRSATAQPHRQRAISPPARLMSPSTIGNSRPDRFGTPATLADVPYTIEPFSILPAPSRDASQSVPPNMSFHQPTTKLTRSKSHSGRSVRRHDFSSPFSTLPALSENAELTPTVTRPQHLNVHTRSQSSDAAFDPALDNSLHQAHSQFFSDSFMQKAKARGKDEASHSGYMKKRKTRMLRHEWHEHHFTLSGTKLAMHKDLVSSQNNTSPPLESIDVDDYAIACSSISSQSKLSSAFKALGISSNSLGLGNNNHPKERDLGAFSFQLVPEVYEKTKGVRRLIGSKGGVGESHHFAVESRDQRIDWMRELMLAKALRAKEDGGEVCVNGNMI